MRSIASAMTLSVAILLSGCTTTDVRADHPWAQSWLISEVTTDEGAFPLTEAMRASVPERIEFTSKDGFRAEDECMEMHGSYDETDGRVMFFGIERFTFGPDEEQTSSLEYCPEGYPRGPLEAGIDIITMTRDTMTWRWKEAATIIEYRAGLPG
ncbi:MAG: hypothetical protein ABFS21_10190 [Actinomycetota bacterium]